MFLVIRKDGQYINADGSDAIDRDHATIMDSPTAHRVRAALPMGGNIEDAFDNSDMDDDD